MTKTHLKSISTIIAGSFLLWACATPKQETPKKPTPPPKPAKTYSDVHIGGDNFMTVPSTWKIKQNTMPKGYVSYTIKNGVAHIGISGYKAQRSSFNINKSKKDLASVTILYRTGSKSNRKTYEMLTDEHKVGGYTHHTCRTNTKCYQVFPLSNWKSVIAADFHAGDMKYTLTAGVDDMASIPAQDVLKAIKSIRPKTSVER